MSDDGHANEVQRFYYEKLKWCGCGNPEGVLSFMRDALRAMDDQSKANRSGAFWNAPHAARDDARKREIDLLPLESPLALSYRYMLDALRLTEHGGSVDGAWLTEEGERVLGILVNADIEASMQED